MPHDEELKASKVEEAHAPEPLDTQPPPFPAADEAEELLVGVVPKKANWDLRRDVAKKLEKLEKRTQARLLLASPALLAHRLHSAARPRGPDAPRGKR